MLLLLLILDGIVVGCGFQVLAAEGVAGGRGLEFAIRKQSRVHSVPAGEGARTYLGRLHFPTGKRILSTSKMASFATAANYLVALELGYLIFRIPPYTNKIARSLKKEKKAYFYDWTRVATKAGRFENYAAVELKSKIDYWQDAGYGEFDLFYIRNRDGRETDFLVTRDGGPWLLVEIKLTRSSIDYQHKKHRQVLGDIPFIQLVLENGVTERAEPGVYQMSASRFFAT